MVWTGGPELVAQFGGAGINSDQKSRGNLVFLAETQTDVQGGTYDPRIFKVYDVTNNNPQLIGHYDDGTQAADALQLSGNYAFLQCDHDFVVLDISNPAAPAKVASLAVTGISLTLSGNRVISGALQGNTPVLTTIDVTQPAAPVIMGSVRIENPAYGFALNGNTLAVATGSTGLYLYDVSNPLAPVKLWNATDGAPAWWVVWSGNLLYTASGTNGLIIRDATNPRGPVTLGSNNLAGFQFSYGDCCVYQPQAVSVYVSGGVAWVGTTDSYASLFGLDVRDTANPRVITVVRFGNALEDQFVTSIGTVGDNLLIGGNYQSFTSMNLISISPPGNVIRPVLPQTTAGDFSPPLQLTPIQSNVVSGPEPAVARRRVGGFFEHKLRHVPEPFRERELKRLRER